MLGSLAQALPHAHPRRAVVGKTEERVFIQTQQRAFQHRGQRQIVFRQQQGVTQRHQIHHRQLIGQYHPIGPADRHPQRL